MKKIFLIPVLLFSIGCLSQKKVTKKFQTQLNEIEILTIGLDDFVLENSNSEFIEIYLYAENANLHHIVFKETKGIAKVAFKIGGGLYKQTIEIKKPITERLKRANVIIKIPKEKEITILGDNINIESKNYIGNLAIFIEKGILKLHKIQANVDAKLYAGSVYATLKNTNINIVSNIGKITVDGVVFQKKVDKKARNFKNNLTINSIKANVFLTSLKTK